MVQAIPYRHLLLVALFSLAAGACGSFAWGQGGAADSEGPEASVVRKTVRGTLQRTWSERRGRHEYYVVNPDEDVRYYVATDQDLSAYVGRRVTLNGTPRQRSEPAAGAVATAGYEASEPELDEPLRRHQVAPAALPAAAPPAAPLGRQAVRTVQHLEQVQLRPGDEIVVEGEVPHGVEQPPIMVDSHLPYLPDGLSTYDSGAMLGLPPLAGPACTDCGAAGAPCPCGVPHRFWVRGDYLLWALKGSYLPPLVTTSVAGTAPANAGVLGQPGTSVLYGDGRYLEELRHGVRLRFGGWLDCCEYWGVEGELFGLNDYTEQYVGQSDGSPILARPFTNALTGQQDAELVAFPQMLAGTVTVDLDSKFYGAGVRGRWNLICQGAADQMGRAGHDCFRGWRLDALGGYRYLQLREDLRIREDLNTTGSGLPATFLITDQFLTRNDFHGGDLGLQMEWHRCRWTLELLGKVALGNSRQSVTIGGSTERSSGGSTVQSNGGLLAQRTNSGTFTQDTFAVVPEFGVTIGYHITQRLTASLGYTMIYWNHVARPGDQIDLQVNPNLFPPEANPFTGPLRPAFAFADSDFWAQGLDFGLRYIW
ncbi:MAG: BBP7 family outer membrane beta-barrel protein [Pirellulaceae bacterium]|nr:BBP7 family outer membrane beta-barrel protein [Pirellulaceae bacterium]